MASRFAARTLGGGLLAAVALLAAGCGSKPVGSVSGTVTYKGAPVKSGSVNFVSATGAADQAKLSESGAYTIPSLEAGEYKVYILPPTPEPQPPGTKLAPPPKFEVPAKYQDAKSSGITKTVTGGKNDIPIDLKD
jgi:hypothetical protein